MRIYILATLNLSLLLCSCSKHTLYAPCFSKKEPFGKTDFIDGVKALIIKWEPRDEDDDIKCEVQSYLNYLRIGSNDAKEPNNVALFMQSQYRMLRPYYRTIKVNTWCDLVSYANVRPILEWAEKVYGESNKAPQVDSNGDRCTYIKKKTKGGWILGISRAWYKTGKLKYEAFFRNGRPHGTTRAWDSHGDIKYIRYFMHDKGEVTRQQYLAAYAKDPTLPKPPDEDMKESEAPKNESQDD